MQIRITCIEHNSPVIPASAELHFIPVNGDRSGEFELDEGDLYCLGGAGGHNFAVDLQDNK